jgi:hypothetical protein
MEPVIAMLALALAVSFAGPAFSADKTPKNQADCEKAGVKWDASTKKCTKP